MRWLSCAIGASLGLVACGGEGEPRPQLLVIVDTNAPLVEQVLADDGFSRDATFDTLRVDVVREDGFVIDFLDVAAPGPRDWPVSFGIAGQDREILLRIRAFPGRFGKVGELNGTATLEPTPEVTIDRMVQLSLPAAGERVVRVVLDPECIGRPSSFLEPRTTCISEAQLLGGPSDGLEFPNSSEVGETQAGSWPRARFQPCMGTQHAGRICIPGGFTILGDGEGVGLDGVVFSPSWPLRPAYLSPFWIDETEFTVGRFRALLASGAYRGQEPTLQTPNDTSFADCTYLGASVLQNDRFALSCVTWQMATDICAAAGGELPTEAQWEYVARGRGMRYSFPWGEAPPRCCATSVSRPSASQVNVQCSGYGPEPVASHRPSPDCDGLGDQSRDGVLDLAGGMFELTQDSFEGFDAPCWNHPGIADNPRCQSDATNSYVFRGGAWATGSALALSFLRHRAFSTEHSAVAGFRCVYRDGG